MPQGVYRRRPDMKSTAIRLDDELYERVDALLEHVTRLHGIRPVRSEVMRLAMALGLSQLEREKRKAER